MKKFLNKLWGKLKYKLTPDSDIAKDFVEECLDFKHNEHLMTFLRKEFKNYKCSISILQIIKLTCEK